MKKLIFTIIIAFVLWTVMFSPWTAPHVNFWLCMSIAAATLTTLTCIFEPGWWKRVHVSGTDLLIGMGVAAALWGVFWIGDVLSQMMFDFARPEVNDIYGRKEGANPVVLSLLLLLLIGPAEEIFWRGYVQQTLSEKFGLNAGYAVATLLYAVVHVGALNFMLFMAALTCGVVWGGLYRFFPNRFAGIIMSHALWDAAVFVWFPL